MCPWLHITQHRTSLNMATVTQPTGSYYKNASCWMATARIRLSGSWQNKVDWGGSTCVSNVFYSKGRNVIMVICGECGYYPTCIFVGISLSFLIQSWHTKACSWRIVVHSLWPSDAIWWHRSRSTLVQVITWRLTASSHYLNQCCLIIGKDHRHSSVVNVTRNDSAISHQN